MNLPDNQTCEFINRMASASNCSFAIYRLPRTDEPIFVWQEAAKPDLMTELTQLNGKKGFILTPFHTGSDCPIIRICPDHVSHTWANIRQDILSHRETVFSTCQPDNTYHLLNTAAETPTEYAETFNKFIAALRNQTYQKLVLSRCATYPLPTGFSPIRAFVHVCNKYPRMMVSMCHTPVSGTWIGSTPEIILSGQGTSWHTVALAGTMKAEKQSSAPWSKKNKEEQAYVSAYIRQALHRLGCEQTESKPYTARAGQLIHLKSDFHFSLKDTSHVGDILAELHPTPAVCGLPKEKALQFITTTELHNRQYYSGIIGWIDPETTTQLYVNLRCMHLTHTTATLYAGGGILPQSEAQSEWEETEEKMNTMRTILLN